MIKVPAIIYKKQFIWISTPKIKKETVSSNFKDQGLKNVDMNKKKQPETT